MGVSYKLKPEIEVFILEKKKESPALSCRGLVAVIKEQLKITVSKSSINSLFKEAGLSMPVGRRKKKRRRLIKPLVAVDFQTQIKALTMPAAEKSELVAKPPIQEQLKPPPSVPEVPIELQPLVSEPVTEAKPEEQPLVSEPVKEEPVLPEPELVQPIVQPPAETPTEVHEVKPEVPPLIPEPVKEDTALPEPGLALPIVQPTAEIPTEVHAEVPSREFREEQNTGVILLKAADYLLGGINFITEAIRSQTRSQAADLRAKTEALLYRPLLGTTERINSYLNELQEVMSLPAYISQVISVLFKGVRGVVIHVLHKGILYLDGQLHTVWSAPYIPYDLSTTIYNIKSYIKKYFQEDRPFVLFMAPGYDKPTSEFFDFILSLDGQRQIIRISIYGNKFEDLETLQLDQSRRRYFIFGLWPWQYRQYRNVKIKGDFKEFNFAVRKKNFYIAETEVELLQPDVNKSFMLRGCALKTNINDKIRLVILSNLSAETTSLESLAYTYLSRWPNLEETFQDYSRKVELFTYMVDSQDFFSTQTLDSSREGTDEINSLFDYYLKILDLYVKYYFLPLGYVDKDFSTIKEQFYDLKTVFDTQKDHILVKFLPPAGYKFLADLGYACRRINEREVVFSGTKRLWLDIGS